MQIEEINSREDTAEMQIKELNSRKDTADLLICSEQTVDRYCRAGLLERIKIGPRRVGITGASIRKMIDAGRLSAVTG